MIRDSIAFQSAIGILGNACLEGKALSKISLLLWERSWCASVSAFRRLSSLRDETGCFSWLWVERKDSIYHYWIYVFRYVLPTWCLSFQPRKRSRRCYLFQCTIDIPACLYLFRQLVCLCVLWLCVGMLCMVLSGCLVWWECSSVVGDRWL